EYGGSDTRLGRIALTPDQEIARLWQSSPSPREGWRRLRRAVRRGERWTATANGRVYDRESEAEVAAFVRDLVETWRRPDSTVHDIRRASTHAWVPAGDESAAKTKAVGPVWIGAGRKLPASAAAVGPSVIWDDPESRPVPADIRWLDLEPSAPPSMPVPKQTRP